MKDCKIAVHESTNKIIELFMKNKELYEQLSALNCYSGQYSKTTTKQLISGETGSVSSLQSNNKMNKTNGHLTQTMKSVKSHFCGKRHIFTIEDIMEKQIELDATASFRIWIGNIVDPFNFFVRAVDDWDKEYLEMDKNINETYKRDQKEFQEFSEEVKYDFVKLNGLCIVQLTNSRFYRAQVISIEKQHYKVFLIDWGDIHSIKRSSIFTILSDFLKLAPHVISCQLDTIEPIEKTWSEKAKDSFKKLFDKDKVYKAKVTGRASKEQIKFRLNKTWPVIIEDYTNYHAAQENCSINDMFVFQGHAKYFEQDKNDELLESVSQNNGHLPKNYSSRRRCAANDTIPLPQENSDVDKSDYVTKFVEETVKFKELESESTQGTERLNIKIVEDKKESIEVKNKAKSYAIIPELENDNPIKDDYESIRNAYGCKEENLEQRLFGYGRYKFIFLIHSAHVNPGTVNPDKPGFKKFPSAHRHP